MGISGKNEIDRLLVSLDKKSREYLRDCWDRNRDPVKASNSYNDLLDARIDFNRAVQSYINRHAQEFAFSERVTQGRA